jgi:hypothetical protein
VGFLKRDSTDSPAEEDADVEESVDDPVLSLALKMLKAHNYMLHTYVEDDPEFVALIQSAAQAAWSVDNGIGEQFYAAMAAMAEAGDETEEAGTAFVAGVLTGLGLSGIARDELAGRALKPTG